MDKLLRKGITQDGAGELEVYTHKVILVADREDRPAQSGWNFNIYIDYQLLNKVTITDYYAVLDLEAYVRHELKPMCYMALDSKLGCNNVVVYLDL